MKVLKVLAMGMCLAIFSSAYAQDEKAEIAPPPEIPQSFAQKNTGPKCGELEEWGRSRVDECMTKAEGERPACVEAGKKEFFNLLMNKYGPQCRFVGKLVGQYADKVGLEVDDKKEPEQVAKGPNPAHICPKWESNAAQVIGQCGKLPKESQKACGMRAVGMLQGAVANQPDIFKICPALGKKLEAMATATFGKETTKELGDHHKKMHAASTKPGGCHDIMNRFKRGIDNCASDPAAGRCLLNLKKEGEKLMSEPKNEVCKHIGNALEQYAYSKPSLRGALNKMRGDQTHYQHEKTDVAESGGQSPQCVAIENKAFKAAEACSKLKENEQFACVQKVAPKVNAAISAAGGCNGLDQRIGEYGQSLGLPDPSSGDPALAEKGEPAEDGLPEACVALEKKAKQSIDHCAGAPEKEKFNCTMGIYADFQLQLSKTPNCGDLDDKIGGYAKTKGLPDPMQGEGVKFPTADELKKEAAPKISKKQARRCNRVLRDAKAVVVKCLGSKDKMKCGARSSKGVRRMVVRNKFSENSCPGQWGDFEEEVNKVGIEF